MGPSKEVKVTDLTFCLFVFVLLTVPVKYPVTTFTEFRVDDCNVAYVDQCARVDVHVCSFGPF